MNRTTVKVGISVIVAGVVLATLGLLLWAAYENCLERQRAFERGESGSLPLCPGDKSGVFLFSALPVSIIGIIVLIMGVKDLPLLPPFKPQSA